MLRVDPSAWTRRGPFSLSIKQKSGRERQMRVTKRTKPKVESLHEGTIHARASGPTVEPDHERGGLWIGGALKQPIEEICVGGVVDGNITGVLREVHYG